MSRLNAIADWIVQEWSARLCQSIEAMAGLMPLVEWSGGADLPLMEGEPFYWRQPLNISGQPFLWIAVPESTWETVGRKILEASDIEPDRQLSRETFQEILGQSFSTLGQALGSRLEREVLSIGGAVDPQPSVSEFRYEIRIVLGEEQLAAIFVSPSEMLVNSLDVPDTKPVVPPPMIVAREPAPLLPASKTLDLLMDVELPVSVSFGRAQLPLKDVVKLTTGAIVELNRSVSEPVEVIVNNCVVARGEVVVIEGNYGVRVQQIISRQERLRTLY